MSTVEERLRQAASAVRAQTDDLPVPASPDALERPDRARRRRNQALVTLATAAAVAVIVAVTVGVTGHASHHGGGPLTIEALAATTEQQSARITITQTASTGSSDRFPYRLVTTGLVDYRADNGRFELTTQSGSSAAQPFAKELVVAGHEYRSIDSWSASVPESVLRTKKWVDIDTQSASVKSSGLNPFDPLSSFKSLHISLVDRGATRFGGQSVEHYTATKRISTPASDGPVESATVRFDIYVDHLGRATHIEIGERDGTTNANVQIDFSDYGVRVEVAAPPANLVVPASELPSDSDPTPTTGRRGALVLRQDIDTSAAECKQPGTLAHTETLGSHGPPLCTELGATIVTGDDVTAAVARPVGGISSQWCVAPTLTADSLAVLRRYIDDNEPIPDLFVISRGGFLGAIDLPASIRNGDCWITTDRMSESVARALAEQLPRR